MGDVSCILILVFISPKLISTLVVQVDLGPTKISPRTSCIPFDNVTNVGHKNNRL